MPVTTTDPTQIRASVSDQLPRFAIGHVSIPVNNVDHLTDFYTSVGLRLVVNMGRASILELRGGTHIILQAGRGGQATLDLIVDNIDDTHKVVAAAGAEVTPIRRGNPHDSFDAIDPEGNELRVHSTHAIGLV